MRAYRVLKLIIVLGLFYVSIPLAAVEKSSAYETLRLEYETAPQPSFYRSILNRKETTPDAATDKGTVEELTAIRANFLKERLKAAQLIDQLAFAKDFTRIDDMVWRQAGLAQDDSEIAEKMLNPVLELSSLVSLGVVRNEKLRASFERTRASLDEYSQAANLLEILSEYSSFTEALNTKTGPRQHKPMLRRSYPYPGIMSQRGAIILKQVEQSQAAYDRDVRNLITNIENNYYQLVFVIQAQAISLETLEQLKSIKEISETLFSAGKTSYFDIIGIQIKIDKQANKLVTLAKKKKVMEEDLRQKLNLPGNISLGSPRPQRLNEIDDDLAELRESAVNNNLELIIISRKLERMGLMIKLMEKMAYPDFSSSSSYFENREILSLGTQSLTKPFPLKLKIPRKTWYGKNDAYLKQLFKKYGALQHQLENEKAGLLFKVEKAYFTYDEARRLRLLLAEQLIPQSEQLLQVSQTAYQSGKIGFSELLMSYNSWLDYQLEHERARLKTNQGVSELERILSKRINKKEKNNGKQK